MEDNGERATFTAMSEGTQADWNIIGGQFRGFAGGLADRVMTHLKLLDGDFGGFPIDRMQHSLQTATRAHRDGRGEDYVVMALLHDIGDTLGSYNHPEIGAAILKPFVRRSTGSARTTAPSRAIISSTSSEWTATRAKRFVGTRISRRARNSARNTIRRRSTRIMTASRWRSSNRWCGGCSRDR
jgi:hypothetical protein